MLVATLVSQINAALEEICHDGSYLGRHLKPLRFVWTLSTIVAISWALASIIGCARYIFLETPPNQSESLGACDPLDESECALPFPSNFYLAEVRDKTSAIFSLHNSNPNTLGLVDGHRLQGQHRRIVAAHHQVWRLHRPVRGQRA